MNTYILIFVFVINNKMTSGTAEFSNKRACVIAAGEVAKQFHAREGVNPAVLTCASKG